LEAEDSKEKAALVRIREFRDFRLALFDKEPKALPIYADLEAASGATGSHPPRAGGSPGPASIKTLTHA
jgi:hypothetical protein